MHYQYLPSLALFLCLFCTSALVAQDVRERDPYLTADGSALFFSRPDHARNQGSKNLSDIWVRKIGPDGKWARAINPGSPVNSFGPDRPVGIGTDGNRLAVLRGGAAPVIDVLERTGRSWSIRNSFPLPAEMREVTDLTFNPTSYELVYASGGRTSDLFLSRIEDGGNWSRPRPLHVLNTGMAETHPTFAPDNRTLYFRSGNRWLLQADRGLTAQRTDISGEVEQLATSLAGPVRAVALMRNDLADIDLLPQALPSPAKQVRGFVALPPPAGERFSLVSVSADRVLRVYPDAQRRYALHLRQGEALDTPSASSLRASGHPSGGLASTRETIPTEEGRLTSAIAYQERALRRLDSLRRATSSDQSYRADPERQALTRKLRAANESNGDTLPPPAHPTRARYADDISELERMKAKFRRQQEEKLSGRTSTPRDRDEIEWSTRGEQPRVYTTTPTPRQREAARLDSLRLQSEINNGLYRDRRTGRDDWERDLRDDLPEDRDITPEERARLNAEYERQMAELEEMRRQLRRARDEPEPVPASPATDRQWEARSPAAPSVYTAPASSPPPATTSAAGIPVGITFIPNTAYPNGPGYGALEQLSRSVQNSGVVVEIRVHTSVNLDRRTAQVLSEERAVTIRNYLLEQGINPANFSVVGYGNNLTANGGERVEILR